MGSIVRSTGYVVLHRPVEPAGIIGMWEFGQFGSRATFRQDDLSGLGMQDCRNEQNSSCFSLWLEVRHVAGEEFFDDPTAFGWVN
jgi:hypothetical protein